LTEGGEHTGVTGTSFFGCAGCSVIFFESELLSLFFAAASVSTSPPPLMDAVRLTPFRRRREYAYAITSLIVLAAALDATSVSVDEVTLPGVRTPR
jgi:hypothetical protein